MTAGMPDRPANLPDTLRLITATAAGTTAQTDALLAVQDALKRIEQFPGWDRTRILNYVDACLRMDRVA